METYKLTAFDPKGEKLLDESFQAENDDHAKSIGEQLLAEKKVADITHRCVSPRGKLILFHR
ncbi:YhzD family protein [Bacillus testis]|uniref:YhzD family protein n=1 Tax=Bacillus testis TaxID=1622072 RepID=UPI00067EB4C7|nr:YhzD family protein [Bacillus testis]